MRRFVVAIEIGGKMRRMGTITEDDAREAVFQYDRDVIRDKGPAISMSLPVQEEAFSAPATKNFFDGLLPEGFTRRLVAQWLHASEDDYLTILYGLGQECLGALQVDDDCNEVPDASYQKLELEEVKKLAAEGASKSAEIVVNSHLSLTGASGKVGLYYDAEEQSWYLPRGTAPSTHIVKQSHVRLQGIVANELLCLKTAKRCGIDVANGFIINTGNAHDEEILLASERYDRRFDDSINYINNKLVPLRLHQEDFAQALGIASINKYEQENAHYLKDMFDLIRVHSAAPLEDMIKLWDMIAFNALIGNADAHLKNYSLLYSKNLKSVRLSPAYDIISTILYPTCTTDMAFSVGGDIRLSAVNRESFRRASADAGLGERMALKRLDMLCRKFEGALRTSASELESLGFVQVRRFCNEILEKGGFARF